MKIYTKTGDDGSTGLLGNVRVRKDAARIESYGDVDELNASLGIVLAHLPSAASSARGWLDAIQSDLFVTGAILATPPQAAKVSASLAPGRIDTLEQQIDQMEKSLKPLKNFILPQGNPCAAFLHLSRAICRRAERRVVALASREKVDSIVTIYLNRLSDYLFVLARWVNHQEGGTETAWINPVRRRPRPAPGRQTQRLPGKTGTGKRTAQIPLRKDHGRTSEEKSRSGKELPAERRSNQ